MSVRQYAVDAISKPANALGVSGITLVTGISNMFAAIQPIIGGIASILSVVVVWCVIKDYRQKRVLRALEIKAMRKVSKFKGVE